MKLLIVGYPKAGKTNYAKQFDDVIHADDYMKFGFKEQIYEILKDIKDKEEWVIEGIQCARLFRKMLQKNESIPDKIIWINPKFPALEKHTNLRTGLDKVWKDCLELNKHVKIDYV